jgi:hypothetical protein
LMYCCVILLMFILRNLSAKQNKYNKQPFVKNNQHKI